MLLGELDTPAALSCSRETPNCATHTTEKTEISYSFTTWKTISCNYSVSYVLFSTHINTPGQVKEEALVLFGLGDNIF